MSTSNAQREETGVDDVRRVREAIARQHNGNLAEHIAETNRIGEALTQQLNLGPVRQPPPRVSKSGTTD